MVILLLLLFIGTLPDFGFGWGVTGKKGSSFMNYFISFVWSLPDFGFGGGGGG